MESQLVSPLLTVGGCLEALIKRARILFLSGNERLCVERPGHDRFPPVLKPLQICDDVGFGFELKVCVTLTGKVRHHQLSKRGEVIEDEAIGVLSGTYSIKFCRRVIECSIELFEHLLSVGVDDGKGIIEIGLQNTIGTVEMAVSGKVENMIVTAEIIFGARTSFKKPPLIAAHKEGLLRVEPVG